MHRGFAKLYRKFLEWEWYDDIPCKVLYVHCLLKANHKPKKYRGVDVARGTFLSGRDTLAKETGLSVQQIRTAMSKIQPEYITSTSTSAGTIISVVDFDTYNGETSTSNQHSNAQATSTPTREQPDINQTSTTTKNVKNADNGKKEKNVKIISRGKDRGSKSGPTWEAYRNAYYQRYGTEPIRDAVTNSNLCKLVDKVGSDVAPSVAAYYLTSSDRWFVTKCHDTQTLIGNAQKLHTEWKTGNRVTSSQATEMDRQQGTGDVWHKILAENAEKERLKNGN